MDLRELPLNAEVWSPNYGKGIIIGKRSSGIYPLDIRFPDVSSHFTFTKEGKALSDSPYSTIAPSELAWIKNPINPWADFKPTIFDRILAWCLL